MNEYEKYISERLETIIVVGTTKNFSPEEIKALIEKWTNYYLVKFKS